MAAADRDYGGYMQMAYYWKLTRMANTTEQALKKTEVFQSAYARLIDGKIGTEQFFNIAWHSALQSAEAQPSQETTTFLRERAQLEQEWAVLRQLQEAAKTHPQPSAPVAQDMDCSTPTEMQPREVLIDRLHSLQEILDSERAAYAELEAKCKAQAERHVLTDAEIKHIWDCHVGQPNEKYPLTDADIFHFARALLSSAQVEAKEGWKLFGAKVLECAREGMGEVDGGCIQDWAVEAGLLVAHQETEPCGEGCRCAEYGIDFPWECFRYSDEAKATIDSLAAPSSQKEGEQGNG
ncbi:MAG: hypothetical protein ACM34A_12025 [Bacillota bacterium]